jgi:hypothetical protein
MMKVIERASQRDTGKFFRWDGHEEAW